MPNLDARLAGRVLAEVLDGAPAAIPEFGRMPGHPVAVSSGLFVQLGLLDGDRGARSVLEDLDGVVRVETHRTGCIQAVDTKKDIDYRSSVVWAQHVAVNEDLGGGRHLKKKTKIKS